MVDGKGKLAKGDIEKLVVEYLDAAQDHHPGRAKQYEIQHQMLLENSGSTCEYIFLPSQLHTLPGKTTMGELLTPSFPDNYISVLALNNHPFSRGSVHIRSADPLEKPIFDPNYLSHPIDLEILARHTQYLDQIANTSPFCSLLKPSSRIPKGADVTNLESAKKIVKDRLLSCFHPAGTCAMMPEELGGVVNNRLIVHGTKNLRVVDASIFPMIPQGNIQAVVYAVAEKAADMIKQGSTDL